MAVKKNKSKSKNPVPKNFGKKVKRKTGSLEDKSYSELMNLTAKKIYIVYRDRKGRVVKPEKLNGRIYIRQEIWRYSEGTGKAKRLDFGRKWELKERKLKRPKTKNEIMKLAEKRFSRHKIEVREIKGEVYAFTASP